MLVLSLFPGIGLLDMAFEEEGFCVVRGPDVLWGGDVRRFHPPAGRFDGVIGGPPCQCFSPLAHLVRAGGREPKFGNLIPEFERCVAEARPAWFLMENVPQAPEPTVGGYGVKSFLLDNSALDGGDGFGLEQRRVRRFSFGVLGVAEPPSLLRWIDLAVFLLPDAAGSVLSQPVDNSPEAKARVPAVVSRPGLEIVGKLGKAKRQEVAAEKRARRQAVLCSYDAVPVAIGGSGKRKPGARVPPVTAGHTDGSDRPHAGKPAVRAGAVTGSDGGPSVRMSRYRLAEACRLQGLPEDFLADAPFTAQGKLKAVANGVPLPMGRAIARAVREAVASRESTEI